MSKRMGIKEAAKYLGISEWSLRQGIMQGKYAYLKFGNGKGKYIVDVEVLESQLNAEAEENRKRKSELYTKYNVKNLRII